MGETTNTARVAGKISEEIFEVFGWEPTGPKDQNFECLCQEKHNKRKAKSHPTDVVFRYYDPMLNQSVYLLTDLKSYATNSIQISKIARAITDLAKSLECARMSTVWKERYLHANDTCTILAMLFVYNHDDKFDKALSEGLRKSSLAAQDLPKNTRIYLIEPIRIDYLLCVADDITRRKGKKQLPQDGTTFFYPDRVEKKPATSYAKAATIEMLIGSWVIMRYQFSENESPLVGFPREGFIIYYMGACRSESEFVFLLEFCSRHQLLDGSRAIKIIVMHDANENAPKHFEAARRSYTSNQTNQRIEAVALERINRVHDKFCSTELGGLNEEDNDDAVQN